MNAFAKMVFAFITAECFVKHVIPAVGNVVKEVFSDGLTPAERAMKKVEKSLERVENIKARLDETEEESAATRKNLQKTLKEAEAIVEVAEKEARKANQVAEEEAKKTKNRIPAEAN